MKYEILNKINNYLKNRLIQFSGVLLVALSFFLFFSIITYSTGQDTFITELDNQESHLKNLGGFYGSALADFLIQSIGFIIFFFFLNLLFWGFKLIAEKKIVYFTSKIFFVSLYIIFATTFFNIKDFFSGPGLFYFHGSGGFVGQTIKEYIFYFYPLIDENEYVVSGFIILALIGNGI